MGLLDDIAKSHDKRRKDLDAAQAAATAEADRKQRESEEEKQRQETRRAQFEAGIQRGHRPWVGDPQYSVGGLHHGGIFEFSECGPDLDGRWVVVQLKVPDARPGSGEPTLWAARDDGEAPKPPYIQMVESAIREEIVNGRLKVIKAIPDEKVFEPETGESQVGGDVHSGFKSVKFAAEPARPTPPPAPKAPVAAPKPAPRPPERQTTTPARPTVTPKAGSSILRPFDDDD
ncbi:MAG: hypothetical protein IV100_24595 [Myxococcales bacterium]|nr:hypothetical protein [Myxococcales bacterium]